MRFTPGSWLRQYLRKVKRRGLTRCFVTCGVHFPLQMRATVWVWSLGCWALGFISDPGDAKRGSESAVGKA